MRVELINSSHLAEDHALEPRADKEHPRMVDNADEGEPHVGDNTKAR
jgi:hypothetical protein